MAGALGMLLPDAHGLICAKTGSTKGPFVDLGVSIPVPYLDSPSRRLVLSELSAREVADTIGWFSPQVVEALEGALLDSHEQIRELEEQLAEARENQTLVVSIEDVIGALPERPEAA